MYKCTVCILSTHQTPCRNVIYYDHLYNYIFACHIIKTSRLDRPSHEFYVVLSKSHDLVGSDIVSYRKSHDFYDKVLSFRSEIFVGHISCDRHPLPHQLYYIFIAIFKAGDMIGSPVKLCGRFNGSALHKTRKHFTTSGLCNIFYYK